MGSFGSLWAALSNLGGASAGVARLGMAAPATAAAPPMTRDQLNAQIPAGALGINRAAACAELLRLVVNSVRPTSIGLAPDRTNARWGRTN